MGIHFGEFILLLVLLEARYAKPAGIFVRIFTMVIPPAFEIAGQVRADQFHRFFDRIAHFEIFPRDPVFRFYPEQMHPCFILVDQMI